MDVFDLRRKLIADYESYVGSFIQLRDARIAGYVGKRLAEGLFWPSPLLQLNPSFEPGEAIGDLIRQGVLHPETDRIFRRKKNQEDQGVEPLVLRRNPRRRLGRQLRPDHGHRFGEEPRLHRADR